MAKRPKVKVQKDKQWPTKHTHKTKDRETLKTGGELRCNLLFIEHFEIIINSEESSQCFSTDMIYYIYLLSKFTFAKLLYF